MELLKKGTKVKVKNIKDLEGKILKVDYFSNKMKGYLLNDGKVNWFVKEEDILK